MVKRFTPDIAPSEITPRAVYLRRREFVAGAVSAGLVGTMMPWTSAVAAPLQFAKSPLSTAEPLTPRKDIISYNNFYEFGADKDDPARNAHTLTTKPWTVKIDGLVGKPADYDFDDLIRNAALEERISQQLLAHGAVARDVRRWVWRLRQRSRRR